jgi:formate/nitrite transporter FocA (FNT family)
MGAAFTLGLVLVLVAGPDLPTGNMMLVPLSAVRGWIGAGDVVKNRALVLKGNLVRAVIFVATACRYLFLEDQPDTVAAPAQESADRA